MRAGKCGRVKSLGGQGCGSRFCAAGRGQERNQMKKILLYAGIPVAALIGGGLFLYSYLLGQGRACIDGEGQPAITACGRAIRYIPSAGKKVIALMGRSDQYWRL